MTNSLPEPCFDIAHLAHVELYTDKFEESLDFFVNVYGLTVSARTEHHAWLRAWDDYEFHTLKLTRHHTTGVGHIAYRASSEAALMRRVAAIEASGYEVIGWVDDDPGHGRAFRFADPFGHIFEIYPIRRALADLAKIGYLDYTEIKKSREIQFVMHSRRPKLQTMQRHES
ncbi:VOC family protein [Chimaeribacter arupi]|uniref:VOC family protein n=1 Tax=Chimaeribacter arupi TaxID=2060066 RepID=UPI0013FD09FE